MAAVFDLHFTPRGTIQAQLRVLLAIPEQSGAEGISPCVLADHRLIEC